MDLSSTAPNAWRPTSYVGVHPLLVSPVLPRMLGITSTDRVGQEVPPSPTPVPSPWTPSIYTILQALSVGASAYHGYRRNDSVGWAVWWGLMGGLFPVITPAIALAQGFGEPAR